jgi:hypothetical protein
VCVVFGKLFIAEQLFEAVTFGLYKADQFITFQLILPEGHGPLLMGSTGDNSLGETQSALLMK